MGDSAFTQSSISVPVSTLQGGSGRTDLSYPGAADTLVGRDTVDVFTGKKTFGSTTFNSAMNMAPGIAPSSPSDGDIWYDGANLFGRFAGATIQMTPTPKVYNLVTPTIVTGTGATGTLISATRDCDAIYSVTITTTASIGGAASGTVVLETCATNSATASDWIEIGRFTNGQSISLAVALQSVQTLAGQVRGYVQKGYYRKLRSINNSGTPTYTLNVGMEVLL